MKYFFALLLLVGTSAFGQSVDVDTTLAKCSSTNKPAAVDNKTADACATGAQLPLLRFNFDGYTITGDLSSKDIGLEVPVGAFKLGISGAASSEKEGDKEKHDSKGSVFVKKLVKFDDSKLDLKLSASRSKVFGGLRDSGAGLQAKYFFNNTNLTPFAVLDTNYKYVTATEKSSLTSSFSLGIRLNIK